MLNNRKTTEDIEREILEKKEKGIEPHDYIIDYSFDDKTKDYQCMICMSLIQTATESKNCGHIFCEHCIFKWYNEQIENGEDPKCPVCKEEIHDVEDLIESKFLNRRIGEIVVECPFCDWKGEHLQFLKHTDPNDKNPCRYLMVDCIDCMEKVKFEALEVHKKETCNFRLIPCEQCNSKVTFHSLNRHIEQYCLETVVDCPNDLCNFSGKRSEYIVHKELCMYEKVLCPLSYMGCKELVERRDIDKHIENSLQSHFLIAEERIKDLEVEVNNLKTKLINYEPINPKHILEEGDLLKYKIGRNWVVCPIINVIDDILELETEDGEILEVSRYSDRLRLMQ